MNLKFLINTLLLIAACVTISPAQNSAALKEYLLTGTVKDYDGNLLHQADVEAMSAAGDAIVVQTDKDGKYSFRLRPGIYSLSFRYKASNTEIHLGVEVGDGKENIFDLAISRSQNTGCLMVSNVSAGVADKFAPAKFGGIGGRVFDINNGVIPGVKIKIVNGDGKIVPGETDEKGEFKIALPKDIYDIEFSMGGFETAVFKKYVIREETGDSLNVTLKVAAGPGLLVEVPAILDKPVKRER